VPAELDRLRELVAGREWFHSWSRGHHAGIDDTPAKLNWLDFPESLKGKSVLDVGSYDGYFAFGSERRGAARVVASDKRCWEPVGLAYWRGFDVAHWALGSKVEKRLISVEYISPASVGKFDVVLFLGVPHHTQDPMRYLRHMFRVCSETLIIETHTDGNDYDEPMMVFYLDDGLLPEGRPERRSVQFLGSERSPHAPPSKAAVPNAAEAPAVCRRGRR